MAASNTVEAIPFEPIPTSEKGWLVPTSHVRPKALRSLVELRDTRDVDVTTARDVIFFVCTKYRIPEERILGSLRTKELSMVRHVAMYVARQVSELSYPELGRVFKKDHTSVIHGCGRIERMMIRDDSFRKLIVDMIAELRA